MTAPPTVRPSHRAVASPPRALLAALAIATCVAAAWFGMLAYVPYRHAAEMAAKNDANERRVMQLRLQNQRSQITVQRLKTRAGIIQAGRAAGMVMPGEVKLVVSPQL